MKFTIESIMKQSTKFLRVYGFERPRHESVLIIKNNLKKSYEDIVTSKDVKISLQARNKILENLFQRLKGKPLSKIYGLDYDFVTGTYSANRYRAYCFNTTTLTKIGV